MGVTNESIAAMCGLIKEQLIDHNEKYTQLCRTSCKLNIMGEGGDKCQQNGAETLRDNQNTAR